MDSTWPILYEDLLVIGNLESNVAICTLWTKREKVAALLDPDQYCVIGNLYSPAGISPMVRNIFAHPTIRYVVLWGQDLSGSGESIVAFWHNGVDNSGNIIGTQGKVESEIGSEAIGELRGSVELLDLRGKPADWLRQRVEALPKLPPFCEPRTFPMPELTPPPVWPSEQFGFRVEGEKIAQVWLRILHTVMRYGEIKPSRYGNNKALKEVINLIAVVNSEDPDSIYYPKYLPMGKEELEEYYPQVLTAQSIPGASYTYGDRLRNYDGIDQIENMIDLIRTRPDSKRMCATTWRVGVDSHATRSGDAPCLTQLNATVRKEKLILTAHFRSQDMFGAWPLNTFAIRKLQRLICDETQLELGPTMIITHSAHIYAWDWDIAETLLEEHQNEARENRVQNDPRGYVIISTNDGHIVLKGYSPNHDLLFEFTDKRAKHLEYLISSMGIFVSPSHLLYIGRELQKAEISLELGLPYFQDQRLPLEILKLKGEVVSC